MPRGERTSRGVIDLFCGAGGFSWGWREAGFDLLTAIDVEGSALRSHELNFRESCKLTLRRDLSTYSPEDLQREARKPLLKPVAVIGGPPCQGWSKVGRGKIRSLRGMAANLLDDPRNQLYRQFLEFVRFFQPSACVMENVPGMLSVEGRNIADLVVLNFSEIGYHCTYDVVNARWFGTPQDRRRLIFCAVPEGNASSLNVTHLRKFSSAFRRRLRLSANVSVRHAIGDLPAVASGADEDPRPYSVRRGRLSHYATLMRRGNNMITDHVARAHNDQDVQAFSTMTEGMQYVDLAPEFKRYRDDIFKDKYKRLYWDRPSWTVTAHLAKDCYTHIHPTQSRTITIREAARLQSFPDSFRFFGNIGDRYRQIGNAVPPLMAWGIAEFVKQHLQVSA